MAGGERGEARVPESGQATFVISADGTVPKVIASGFDMTEHAHAALESSQNPDEQITWPIGPASAGAGDRLVTVP